MPDTPDPPEKVPASPAGLRIAATAVGASFAFIGFGLAADPTADVWNRVWVGGVGLVSVGVTVGAWVPPVGRSAWWVMEKLK